MEETVFTVDEVHLLHAMGKTFSEIWKMDVPKTREWLKEALQAKETADGRRET